MPSEKNAGFKYTRNKDIKLEDTFTDKNKRDKRDYKSITFFIDEGTHTNFKTYCAKNKTTMTDVLVDCINSIVES